MKLDLHRIAFKDTYTIGNLSVEGVYECDCLEDKYRGNEPKVPGQTCIPFGTYKVILDYSNRFQRIMPHILDVPDFEGIRIHNGNFAGDTAGCLLTGQNKVIGQVINSRLCFNALFKKLQSATDEITIEIT
jgi:hypothetical protein